MAEADVITTSGGRFRTNRYPGFYSGGTDRSTGNQFTPSSKALSGINEAVPNQNQSSAIGNIYASDTPIPKAPGFGEIAKSFAPSAGSYFGEKLGNAYGGEIGTAVFGNEAGEFLGSSIPNVTGWGAGETIGSLVGGESGGVAAGGIAGEVTGDAVGELSGSWGGAAGAGIGAGIGTLIATGDVGKAAGAGAGTAIGNAIGTAFGGPIGGFIGGAIGGAVGGRVICTELNHQGLLSDDLLALDRAYTLSLSDEVIRGYHVWAVPFVRMMRKHSLITKIALPLAIWRAEEIAYQMGVRQTPHYRGKAVRVIGESICWVIGHFVGATDWTILYKEQLPCQ